MLKRFLKRVRGIVGTAVTWAIGWTGVRVVLGALAGLNLQYLGYYAISGAVGGLIAGSSFAVLLSIVERHKTIEGLSLKRMALWGGVGGMILACIPLAFGFPITMMLRPLIIDGLMGAGFASGSVALAKRANAKELARGDDMSKLMLEGD